MPALPDAGTDVDHHLRPAPRETRNVCRETRELGVNVLGTLRPRGLALPPVEHGDVVPCFEKLPNDEGAYETRAAQDEDAGHGPIVCATTRLRCSA